MTPEQRETTCFHYELNPTWPESVPSDFEKNFRAKLEIERLREMGRFQAEKSSEIQTFVPGRPVISPFKRFWYKFLKRETPPSETGDRAVAGNSSCDGPQGVGPPRPPPHHGNPAQLGRDEDMFAADDDQVVGEPLHHPRLRNPRPTPPQKGQTRHLAFSHRSQHPNTTLSL